MTYIEIQKLVNGVYRIYWKGDEKHPSSVGVVSRSPWGNVMLYCSNWSHSDRKLSVMANFGGSIERVDLLATQKEDFRKPKEDPWITEAEELPDEFMLNGITYKKIVPEILKNPNPRDRVEPINQVEVLRSATEIIKAYLLSPHALEETESECINAAEEYLETLYKELTSA